MYCSVKHLHCAKCKIIVDPDPFFSFPAGGALRHLITAGTGLAQDLAHTAHVSGFKRLEQSKFSTYAPST